MVFLALSWLQLWIVHYASRTLILMLLYSYKERNINDSLISELVRPPRISKGNPGECYTNGKKFWKIQQNVTFVTVGVKGKTLSRSRTVGQHLNTFFPITYSKCASARTASQKDKEPTATILLRWVLSVEISVDED